MFQITAKHSTLSELSPSLQIHEGLEHLTETNQFQGF